MTSNVLAEILTAHGEFQRDGDHLTAPPGVIATLFASLGQESLIVERVASVHLEPDVVVVATARKERFVIAYEDVRALRFGSKATTGYKG